MGPNWGPRYLNRTYFGATWSPRVRGFSTAATGKLVDHWRCDSAKDALHIMSQGQNSWSPVPNVAMLGSYLMGEGCMAGGGIGLYEMDIWEPD